jgi:hypothetical protein
MYYIPGIPLPLLFLKPTTVTLGDIHLRMPNFLQHINLDSLFSGKLFVGFHKCSFDLAV